MTPMLRDIPDSMEEALVAQIDARLVAIQRDHLVTIPLAIESGSRAWGFPSTDSDYDCRFIYVRRAQDYLSLWPKRDVIETPLDRLLDISGWDLGKALKLLLKGNAVVVEWLTSPISYGTDPEFKDQCLALAREGGDRKLIGRHYLHLGERQRRTYFGDGKPVPQKKIFYALRPAAALRWLRNHPGDSVAPMNFPRLMAECSPPFDVIDIVQALIARKAETRDLKAEPLPDSIRRFIDGEFEMARDIFEVSPSPASPEAQQRCNEFFRAWLTRMEATLLS